MVKGTATTKGAAELRRSAIAERLRLREEWSSLKGTNDENEPPSKVKKKQTRAFSKNLHNIKEKNTVTRRNMFNLDRGSRRKKENSQPQSSNDTLRGVVALVDVGIESRALALRAALSALGATVVSDWSPLVTHLIWSQGGCRDTRARARALACRVVSPLWVEACAASARRISEKVFPSTARDSDLPSPATLCKLLKTAEKADWLVSELQSNSEGDGGRRLRLSSDIDEDTRKKTGDGGIIKESIGVENRVNTALRRALPMSMSPPPANPKSRRKLFTARLDGDDDSGAEDTPTIFRKAKTRPEKARTHPDMSPNRPGKTSARVQGAAERQRKVKKYNLTQEQKRNLEKAGRMAKKLATDPERIQRDPKNRVQGTQSQRRRRCNMPRIVLSGMPRSQYQAVFTAIQTLKGRVQKEVNYRTTHVLLGSCKKDRRHNQRTGTKPQEITTKNTPQQSKNKLSTTKTPVKPFSICNRCNSPEGLVMRMFECDNVDITDHCSNPTSVRDKDVTIICSTANRNFNDVIDGDEVISDNCNNHDISDVYNGINNDKRLRTLKTLLGAARGCRVLHAQWALDSLKEKKWLPHVGYEVTHLLKIQQRARVERSAIEKMHSEYGYNVFRGMRVSVTETADQRDAAVQLLSLCGAELVSEANAQIIINNNNELAIDKTTQYSGRTQNGAQIEDSCDIVVVGKADEEVSSKWVFDSVAAGRPRTTRRYINKNIVAL